MTEKDYPFIGFFEDGDGIGVEGLTVTIVAKKVLRTDVTSNSSFLNGASVTEELGGGFYAYQGVDLDLELYYYPFKMITASGDVAYKEVTGMQYSNPADILAIIDTLADAILVDTGTTLPAQIDTLLLTNASTAAASQTDGANLLFTNRVTFSALVSDLTIPTNWVTILLTVKDSTTYDDEKAILQVQVSNPAVSADDGILYINKDTATATERLYGSLTADQPNGTLRLDIEDDADLRSYIHTYGYDIKIKDDASDTFKPAKSANFTIQETETRAV